MSENQEPLSISEVLETLQQPSNVASSVEEAEASVVAQVGFEYANQDAAEQEKS